MPCWRFKVGAALRDETHTYKMGNQEI